MAAHLVLADVAAAITIFPVGIFLAAALFVIAYVMWEARIVYKLTASEALGVGGATLTVILLCLLLLSKACAAAGAARQAPPLRSPYPLSSDGGMRGDFSTDLLIYLGDGAGNFTQGQTVTVGKEPGSTWTADFNKDGHTDIACSNRTDGTLSILLGNGDGTFVIHATIQLNALSTP